MFTCNCINKDAAYFSFAEDQKSPMIKLDLGNPALKYNQKVPFEL